MQTIFNYLIVILLGIVGGLPCAYLVLSIPAVLVWKFYRKARYNISIFK